MSFWNAVFTMQLADLLKIVGLLIVILGIVLGFYKWKKSESNKVKREMFEKRKRIYENLRALIAYVLSKGDISDEDLNKISRDIRDYEIIFNQNKEIQKYIATLLHRARDLQFKNKKLKMEKSEKQREQILNDTGRDIEWFSKQLNEEAYKVFSTSFPST